MHISNYGKDKHKKEAGCPKNGKIREKDQVWKRKKDPVKKADEHLIDSSHCRFHHNRFGSLHIHTIY